jgi:hypothetical protein
MSVLAPEVHNELAQLLDALQSSDNSVRSQAEEHLANNWTTNKPNMLLMGLVEQIQGSNDPTVIYNRTTILGLLLILLDIPDPLLCCRHFPPDSLQSSQFLSLPQEEGYLIRSKLLEALKSEGTNPVRNKIGDAVAEIAREYSDSSTSYHHDFLIILPLFERLTPRRSPMARDIGCSL